MRERMANESPQRSRRNRTIQPVTVEPTEPPTMETWATGIGGYLLPRSLSSLVDYGGALGVGAQGYARRKVKGEHVPEHRRILFRRIGVGWHPCHHCGTMVTWEHSLKKNPDTALVVDHLDENKLNNDPANLVPSCNICNASRNQRKCEPITFNGVTRGCHEWAESLGITVTALGYRLERWPLERALTERSQRAR